MISKISFMSAPIRCLEGSYKQLSKKGLQQTINKYTTKNNQQITEVITDLGNGKQGIREIYATPDGKVEKVVDRMFGRIETYTTDGRKVFQETDDGVLTNLHISYWDSLTKI